MRKKKQYRFPELSKAERECYEEVLLEEMDIQTWFMVAWSEMFSEELLIFIQ